MKKLFFIILILFLGSSAGAQNPREIMEISYQLTRLKGSEAVSSMTIVDAAGRKRVRRIAQASKLADGGGTEKKLIRFLEPADVRGTGLLIFDYEDKADDMWIFMPALRRTRRIVSSEKAKSFMGSEFYYADMTPPPLDDFTYALLGEETVGGQLCRHIEMVPKDNSIADENGFSKRHVWIAVSDTIPRKALYFDLNGEPHRELRIHEIKAFDLKEKRFHAVHLEMVNLQNARKSILKIEQIVYNENVNDDFFTISYLERP